MTVIAAIGIKLLMPYNPPCVTLFPVVVLCAFIGGKWTGRVSLAVCAGAAEYFLHNQSMENVQAWEAVSWLAFVKSSIMIVFAIELLGDG